MAGFVYNLTNLMTFSGRENRAQFWPYAGVVFALSFVALAAVMLPEISASMTRMEKFAIEHPDISTIERGPGSYSITIQGYHPELMPDVAHALLLMTPVLFLMIVLLAGAIARRLHDRGKSAFWGLAPIPFLLFAGFAMPRLFALDLADVAAILPLFFAVFFNNILYLAALAYLIVLLAGDSVKGENRFGPAA